MAPEDIENRFKYHPPLTPEIGRQHDRIRTYLGQMATELNETLPESREKSLAITHLEETMMWANAAIARNQEAGQ